MVAAQLAELTKLSNIAVGGIETAQVQMARMMSQFDNRQDRLSAEMAEMLAMVKDATKPPPRPEAGARMFKYADLVAATSQFSSAVGPGLLQNLFLGELPSGEKVVVKRYSPPGKPDGKPEAAALSAYSREVSVAGTFFHDNLIRMLGFSQEPNKAHCVVYENRHKDSLERRLYKKTYTELPLTAEQRLLIATPVAAAVHYLHSQKPDAVVNRKVTCDR